MGHRSGLRGARLGSIGGIAFERIKLKAVGTKELDKMLEHWRVLDKHARNAVLALGSVLGNKQGIGRGFFGRDGHELCF